MKIESRITLLTPYERHRASQYAQRNGNPVGMLFRRLWKVSSILCCALSESHDLQFADYGSVRTMSIHE